MNFWEGLILLIPFPLEKEVPKPYAELYLYDVNQTKLLKYMDINFRLNGKVSLAQDIHAHGVMKGCQKTPFIISVKLQKA